MAYVVEILKVKWSQAGLDPLADPCDLSINHWMQLTDYPQTEILLKNEVSLIDRMEMFWRAWLQPGAGGGGASSIFHNEIIHDLTDGAGHGLIYPFAKISVGVESAGTTTPSRANCTLIYRVKKVTVNELFYLRQ